MYLRLFCFLNIRGDFRIFSNLLVSFHAFLGNFGKNVGKFHEFTNGLSAGYPQEFLLRIIEMNVRVGVQRHADIAVSHDILQRFGFIPDFAMLEQKVCLHTWGVIFGSCTR